LPCNPEILSYKYYNQGYVRNVIQLKNVARINATLDFGVLATPPQIGVMDIKVNLIDAVSGQTIKGDFKVSDNDSINRVINASNGTFRTLSSPFFEITPLVNGYFSQKQKYIITEETNSINVYMTPASEDISSYNRAELRWQGNQDIELFVRGKNTVSGEICEVSKSSPYCASAKHLISRADGEFGKQVILFKDLENWNFVTFIRSNQEIITEKRILQQKYFSSSDMNIEVLVFGPSGGSTTNDSSANAGYLELIPPKGTVINNPQPVPKPEPVPTPEPVPVPKPEPVPTPEPVPVPTPEPVPVPKPEPVPTPEPVPFSPGDAQLIPFKPINAKKWLDETNQVEYYVVEAQGVKCLFALPVSETTLTTEINFLENDTILVAKPDTGKSIGCLDGQNRKMQISDQTLAKLKSLTPESVTKENISKVLPKASVSSLGRVSSKDAIITKEYFKYFITIDGDSNLDALLNSKLQEVDQTVGIAKLAGYKVKSD
jgi:hypothetical protein